MVVDAAGVTSALPDGALELARRAGLRGPASFEPLRGGSNNRVFRVIGERFEALLKAYFRHPADPRDRLAAESALCHFAWEAGVTTVPRPLARDDVHGLGLYELIHGQPVAPDEVAGAHVAAAIDFYQQLNRQRTRPGAEALPAASEACFSWADHVTLVERRVERLRAIDGDAPTERDAARLGTKVEHVWQRVLARVRPETASAGGLAPADRRLSPSDFGFHNALVEPGGRLRFIDFEYAGWDDAAKTVCDFFCQVAVPVPATYFGAFARAVAEDFPDPDAQCRRFAGLLPIYRVKWCCILLNDFLPGGRERRRYAHGGEDRRAGQLQKVAALLARIDEGRD